MPASEAQIRANQANAQKSTGPKTEEGKAASRGNALKHGLTGQGVVLLQADAAEVERRFSSFAEELNASGDVGLALARRAALTSVRMERAADQQAAALLEQARRFDAEFVLPEGLDEAEAEQLRSEAARRSLFDSSKEAILARKYEAAAERTFLRCIKELRERDQAEEAEMQQVDEVDYEAKMASFLKMQESFRQEDEEFDDLCAQMDMPMPRRPFKSPQTASLPGKVDLPIGKLPPR